MECPNQTSVTEFLLMAFTKRSTQYPPIYITIFLFLYLVILGENILMMLVIKVDARLHSPMYFFVFSLCCLDICYVTTIIPQVIHNLTSAKSSIYYHNCVLQVFFIHAFGAIQIMVINSMGYDRYVAISNPLRYTTIMSWATCSLFLSIECIIGILLGTLVISTVFSLPYCIKAEIKHFVCGAAEVMDVTVADELRAWISDAICFLAALFFFCSSFIFTVVGYAYIISSVLKIHTNQGRKKAFSTCSSHLTVVVVENLCLGFIYLKPKEAHALDTNKVFVMIFTLTTPILNPIIYTLRNEAMKKGFIKLISKKLR